jgi:hypothetical protein
VKVISAWLRFHPSPMSVLWATVPTDKLGARMEDKLRKNFLNVESVLQTPYKLAYPSTLECFFKLTSPGTELSDARLQEISVNWIRAVIAEPLAAQDIFGYGCVHGTCRRMLMVTSLGPPEIDDLGPKFENIYPILFGSRASCEALSAVLAGSSELILISEKAPSAILSITPDGVRNASRDLAVRNWIIARPITHDQLSPQVYVIPRKKATDQE